MGYGYTLAVIYLARVSMPYDLHTLVYLDAKMETYKHSTG
jgi:hypothetical protein